MEIDKSLVKNVSRYILEALENYDWPKDMDESSIVTHVAVAGQLSSIAIGIAGGVPAETLRESFVDFLAQVVNAEASG